MSMFNVLLGYGAAAAPIVYGALSTTDKNAGVTLSKREPHGGGVWLWLI